VAMLELGCLFGVLGVASRHSGRMELHRPVYKCWMTASYYTVHLFIYMYFVELQ